MQSDQERGTCKQPVALSRFSSCPRDQLYNCVFPRHPISNVFFVLFLILKTSFENIDKSIKLLGSSKRACVLWTPSYPKLHHQEIFFLISLMSFYEMDDVLLRKSAVLYIAVIKLTTIRSQIVFSYLFNSIVLYKGFGDGDGQLLLKVNEAHERPRCEVFRRRRRAGSFGLGQREQL